MLKKQQLFFGTTLLAGGLLASGCASNQWMQISDLKGQLSDTQEQVTVLESSVKDKDMALSSLENRLGQTEAQRQAEAEAARRAKMDAEQARSAANRAEAQARAAKAVPQSMATESALLPPGAKPGGCYARVFIPPQYRTETERVQVREAAFEIETVPAQYEWVEETVMTKAASERLEVIPAAYKWIEEEVLVKPASQIIEDVPPVYETLTERIMDRPAHTIWKKGRGPIEKVDAATGEIMCLVDVPATYKTVTKRVLRTPATTRVVDVPAKYDTVKTRVMDTPPITRKVMIPAEYKTVRVQKLVRDPQEKRIPIPEQFDTVTKTIKVSEGHMEWRPILCETNITPEIVMSIQQALREKGHNPGPIDGVIGSQTMTAVKSFQKEKGLAQGGLTVTTLKELGVKVGDAI